MAAKTSGHQTAEHAANPKPGQQQPIADAAKPQLILGEQHQDRLAGHGRQVHQPNHDGQGPQQPVAEQPAQPLGDVDPQAKAWGLGGTLGREPAADRGDQRRADRERRRIGQERDRGGQREQEAASGRADEVLAHRLGAVELAVARSSRWVSRVTRAGMSDCAALSNSVWPMPSRNPTVASSGMVAPPANTATPRPPTKAKRTASTVHITRRRSQRSTSAPLTSPNSSHGSQPAKATSDTCSGSRLRMAASSGSAARNTPSPKVETAAAVQSLW